MHLSELCACGRGGGRAGRCNRDSFSTTRSVSKFGREELRRPVEPSKKKRTAAFQKTVMSIFRSPLKHQNCAQKSSCKLNPYAGGGRDKVSLVAAEIADQGGTLAVQIGDRGPVVRFARRPTRKWIPSLISLKHKSAAQEKQSNLSPAGTVTFDRIVPPEASSEAMISLVAARVTDSEDHRGTDTIHEIFETSLEEGRTSTAFSDKNPQWHKLRKTATVVGTAALGTFFIGKIVAMGITMTVALTFGMLLNKRHGRNLSVEIADGTSSRKVQEEVKCSSQISEGYGSLHEHRQASQASVPIALPENSLQCDLSSISPAHHKKPFVALMKQTSAPEFMQSISPSSEINLSANKVAKRDPKQRSRSKAKLQRKRALVDAPFTSPNSPLGSISPNSVSCLNPSRPHPSAVATLFRHNSSELGNKSSDEKQHPKLASHNPHKHKSSYPVSHFPPGHELREMKSGQIGLSSAAIGIFIALTGLLSGHMLALICLVCWWYTLPKLRQLLGETSSFGVVPDPGDQKDKSIIPDINGQQDLHSNEYKKRVIIEGLLERNRRLTI